MLYCTICHGDVLYDMHDVNSCHMMSNRLQLVVRKHAPLEQAWPAGAVCPTHSSACALQYCYLYYSTAV
jgi:hypothetical protein